MPNTLAVQSSTPIRNVTYPAITGQPVTEPVIGYNGSGFVAEIVLTGLTSVTGTVDATKIALTVTDPGYDSTGTTTVVTRHISGLGILVRQFQDPLTGESQGSNPDANVTCLITTDGTNLTLYVVLTDWIYAGSTITACTIANGFYTGYTAGTVTPTNSSDLAYPLPIFGWHTPHYLSTAGASTLAVEAMAFHRHAGNGQQVACVKYQATDAHSTSGAVASVGSPTLSTLAPQGKLPEGGGGNVHF